MFNRVIVKHWCYGLGPAPFFLVPNLLRGYSSLCRGAGAQAEKISQLGQRGRLSAEPSPMIDRHPVASGHIDSVESVNVF